VLAVLNEAWALAASDDTALEVAHSARERAVVFTGDFGLLT
jgi:hypothetical protein